MQETFNGLAELMRAKEERDEAIQLLRKVLGVREMGSQGPIKSDVREFLERCAK